jgi:hypothetical protein
MKKIYVTSICPVARIGDRMKTVISCFIFAELLGAEVVLNKSWSNYKKVQEHRKSRASKEEGPLDFKPIIKEKTYTNFFRAKPTKPFERILIKDRNYAGYTYEQFLEIQRKVENSKSNCVFLKFKGVCRLQLTDVLEWEKTGKIKPGCCLKVTQLLRKLYFYDKAPSFRQMTTRLLRQLCFFDRHEKKTENLVCIQIRRGDLITNPIYEKRATVLKEEQGLQYYSQLIRRINMEFSEKGITPTIEVHTEALGSEDIEDLSKEENVQIIRGGAYATPPNLSPTDAFYRLCVADRLYIYNSGFSYLASLINPNDIYAPHFILENHFLHLDNFHRLEPI